MYVYIHGTDRNSGSLISCPRGSRRGYIISPVRRKERKGDRRVRRSCRSSWEKCRAYRSLEIISRPPREVLSDLQRSAATRPISGSPLERATPVGADRETRASRLISIVGGPRIIYHDSLREARGRVRIDIKLATVVCVRSRRDRRANLSVKGTRVRTCENRFRCSRER